VSGYANDRAGAAEKLLNEEQMPEPSYFSLWLYFLFFSFLLLLPPVPTFFFD
jgi:hypothetical protein